ncbi:MAG TPA: DUF4245 domain-containing protein [Actinophytocola sp.]|uniref:DUF4245 domain-containing protein n=1 Tax=Actinophytocola sp. TaxID=1872138 RepID=UPI002DB7F259|nr:DUF4245 domain-containing protein [Actinophytocola sp.]HEU5472062.1 DUF4245 domain-containing protein [Actinophytocola sp.]
MGSVVHTPPESQQENPVPPRIRAGVRDLLGSLAVLLVIMGVLVGFSRGCSFSPGGPTVDQGAAPSADVSRDLAAAAGSVDFAIRRPEVPAGWRANSSSVSAVGAGASVVVRVGWLTPDGRFVQLSQSGGEPADVVAAETGQRGPRATGQVDVLGTTWTTYPGRRAEQAWVTRLDGVTTLITGSAAEADFQVLARAVQAAAPVAKPTR